MRIFLTPSEESISTATRAIRDISDPASPNFGQHWSAAAVARHFHHAPAQQEVMSWLQEAVGISDPSLSAGQGHLTFQITVEQADRLLRTRYTLVPKSMARDAELILAADEYSLPADVDRYIDAIEPSFPLHLPIDRHRRSSRSTARDVSSGDLLHGSLGRRANESKAAAIDCLKYTTPACLRSLYHIPPPKDKEVIHSNNTFGIFQMSWMTWFTKDFDAFFSRLEPQLVGRYPEMQAISGGYTQTELQNSVFNAEPAVDFQYALSLTHPQPVINIQVGDKDQSAKTNHMLAAYDAHYCDALDPTVDPVYNETTLDCGGFEAPKVISISYSWNEESFPDRYLQRQCLEYMKLGLQGVTVLAATGDGGTTDQVGRCIDSASGNITEIDRTSGQVEDAEGERYFSTSFPASCPWVTAVGGTMLSPATNSSSSSSRNSRTTTPPRDAKWKNSTLPPEVAYQYRPPNSTRLSTSAGGFSRHFPTPDFQANETAAYLDRQRDHWVRFAPRFHPHGRAVPDVSALASNYLVYYNDNFRAIHGTSVATPVVASMIARVNNARLLAGKGTVGFINQVLYDHPELFNDVGKGGGENSGCGIVEAFATERGWDPVTGLGSLDYERLLELYMSLP